MLVVRRYNDVLIISCIFFFDLLTDMTCGIECIDKWLTKAFYRLGLVVAKHPGYFLLVPVFLTAICITGFQRVKFEIDPEYLFSPEQGPGKTERAIVESYFKMNYSSLFNPTRITRPGTKRA